MIYDVFGYSSQILRGADILAAAGYLVFMPDFFSSPAPMEWMAMPDIVTGIEPAADEQALEDFCAGPGNTQQTVDKVLRLQRLLDDEQSQSTIWGLIGYCWGGYVANFLLQADMPFVACAELHPGFPGREIAETVARPILALCSKDELEAEYKDFRPHVRSAFHAVHFDTMLHGWMSSRGDLTKPDIELEYCKGYDLLIEFFAKHL